MISRFLLPAAGWHPCHLMFHNSRCPCEKADKRIACIGRLIAMLALVLLHPLCSYSQQNGLVVNLAPVDGLELAPDNIFSFRVESALTAAVTTQIKGTVRYRNSPLQFSYRFTTTIRPGSNAFDISGINPSWDFSSTALRELFLNYRKMPQGTYEYCVTLTPAAVNNEVPQEGVLSECLYHQADDVFLINLVDPENGAKIHEYNPVLSWTVNYPFASALTYRLRVAEIKDGQNTVNAITRNNPIYQEGKLQQNSLAYPVYGKPLQAWQPYAWTVDAYYKDLLLGGAEPWKFTVVEDSLLAGVPKTTPYVDIEKEIFKDNTYGIGNIRIYYKLKDRMVDALVLKLYDGDREINIGEHAKKEAKVGENRFEIQLDDKPRLTHLKSYTLKILSESGKTFKVNFKYINPDFL